jgi:ADP-ribosyl-[dinitrogen reductase] hydrolase
MAELKQGRDVCLHCKGGIGRSGTVTGLLLVDHGEGSDDAIDRIRQARPGAIETAEQGLY